MLRALLIDDEPGARADLRLSLAAHAAEVEITGEAETMDEAEALLAQPAYDVVFLDVQLRGGTAFDLVPRIHPGARVVFVTAHDKYAVRAFQVNALDYLLKPIDETWLAATIERLLRPAPRTPAGDSAAQEEPSAGYRFDDSVMLRTDTDVAHFVRLREVVAIFSTSNYTRLRFVDGTRLMVRRTLKSWALLLPPDFMRVHRTALVNLHAVQRVAHVDRQVSHVFVQGHPEPIRARRELWPELQQRLAGRGSGLG